VISEFVVSMNNSIINVDLVKKYIQKREKIPLALVSIDSELKLLFLIYNLALEDDYSVAERNLIVAQLLSLANKQ